MLTTRRRRFIALILVAGTASFAMVFRSAPGEDALAAHFARAFSLAAVFSLSCLVCGHSLLMRVLKRSLPFEEHLAVALALGVLAFFFTSCVFGFAGLYGMPFFLLAPCLMIAFGWRDTVRTVTRLRRHLANVDLQLRLNLLDGVILAFGTIGIALLWCSTLTPQNASYDARWYHLALAEEYVARGAIQRFSEGWVHGAFPQLASLIYVWAFSLPGSVFDHVVAAAQLEFCVFLMTLVGVVAMVRRVLGRRAPLSWSAVLLFPGIFCYDSGLVVGADHFAALWAAPIFLLLLRQRQNGNRETAVLLGALIAGALNTKYTAVLLLPLPIVFLIHTLAHSKSEGTKRPLMLWVIASTIGFTTPYWLRNLIFYGDPFFPALRRWLPVHPWSSAEEAPYNVAYALYRPAFSLATLLDSFRTLATFSFVPHDFPEFHGAVPVFGSLFTVCTPIAAVACRKHGLRWLFVGPYLGLLVWFWLHQLDRYLQVLVPWMAAATAVVMTLVWEDGGLLRPLLAPLVAIQVAWGVTVPFRFIHRAAGEQIYQVVLALIERGTSVDPPSHVTDYTAWESVGRALPRGARLLVHEEDIHLGVARVTLRDSPGDQGSFYWGEPGATNSAEIWRLLKAQGVSHIVWANQTDHGEATVASSLVFFDFVTHHTKSLGIYSALALAELPQSSPADVPPGQVAYFPCEGGGITPGLYELSELLRPPPEERPGSAPRPPLSMEEAFERARFLVFDPSCHGQLPRVTRNQFELLAHRGNAMLLERRVAQ